MSETVLVTLGGEDVSVVIEGGNMAAGASLVLSDLNGVVARAEQAADDAEAAAAAVGGIAASKADLNGANIGSNAPAFRASIGAGPLDVTTYIAGITEEKRLIADKLRDFVNAQDAPAFDIARATDAKASLEALFSVRSGLGGDVYLPAGDIYVSSLTIPPGVRVYAAGTRPGENQFNRVPNKYGTTIWVDPAGTILIQNMGWLEGVRVLNPKINYPYIKPDNTASATYNEVMGIDAYTSGPFAGKKAGVAQFSGTAITIGGDDTMVKDCLVIGFDRTYYSAAYSGTALNLPGPSRQNIDGLYFDCTNGIEITNCWDIARIRNCNAWNFYCSHIPGLSQWGLVARRGKAYYIHDHVDGLMMTNCFGLGWDFTYWFENIYAAQVTGCTGDGAVDTSVAAPLGAGLITKGSILGLHLNSVRCDGNKTNFKFQHTTGSVDGKIVSGQTSNGIMVEVGDTGVVCNGLTLDVVLAGNTVDGIRIRNGSKNICFPSIDAVFLIPSAGEIIKLDTAGDIKNVAIGFVNKDNKTHTRGFRVPDEIIAGGDKDITLKLSGTVAGGDVRSAASGTLPAGYAVEAVGDVQDTSAVKVIRRTLAGVAQLLARMDAATGIVPPSWLFRAQDVNTLDIIAEGAQSDVNIRIRPKGNGVASVFANFVAGAQATNSVSMFGANSGTRPGVRALGGDTNIGIDLQGRGTGGVYLSDLSGATRYQIARFFRTSDTAPSLAVNCATGLAVIAPEGTDTNLTLALAGKGAGGVRVELPTYANDAAAATGGLPIASLYKTATGEVRVRIS